MALKDRFRKAISSTSSRKDSASASQSSSTASSSPSSSGFTTPATLSRDPSTTQLPNLFPSPTSTSTSFNLTQTTTSASTLTKTSSATSKLSLSRFRSSSSSKKENWAKYAPRNYKFGVANPEKVATLSAWEWSFGANARASVSSAYSGVSPSRRNSLDVPRAMHVEDVTVGQ